MSDGPDDVVAVGQPRPFQLGRVRRRRRRGADPFDRRVEIPERLACRDGGDLGADAERHGGLMGDQQSTGPMHRVEDRHHVEGSDGAQVDHLDGDPFAGQLLGGGEGLVQHP